MADSKISALPSSTTPLAGTEVLPIVQGGVTKQVSIANLTAGRSVASAGGTFSDNMIQGTAAKGVNFTANTPAAGMTSQLLNWHEEGTWTPTDTSGAGLTFASFEGTYTRTGNAVVATAFIVFPATGDTSSVTIGGLPFTCKNTTASMYAASISVTTYTVPFTGAVISNTKNVQFITFGATNITNANMSNNTLRFTATYQV